MEKGDRVLVKATVLPCETVQAKGEDIKLVHEAKYGPHKRNLYRWPEVLPFEALVVGFSFRRTGSEQWDNAGPYLNLVEDHKVIMVQPLHRRRWLKPIACFEEDLELLSGDDA